MIEPLEIRDLDGDGLKFSVAASPQRAPTVWVDAEEGADVRFWVWDRRRAEQVRDWLNEYLREESEGS